MKICFLRHGEADWPDWKKADDERPLTERGRREMKQVARFLDHLKLSADCIFTSPLPRASQTADIVGQRIGLAVQVEPKLAHGFNLDRLRQLIAGLEAKCVMLVGHEPEFSQVIKELTGGKIKISKAGIGLVEAKSDCTSGRLLWLLPPKIAKAGVD